MSELFNKILKNKYLFSYLLSKIKSDVVEFKQLSNYYSGNRIGFDELFSLNFLAKKGLWKILVDRIQSNQYIQYNQESLSLFIKECKDITVVKLFISNFQNNQLLSHRGQIYNPIYSLIDLVDASISHENVLALNYFINELKLPIVPASINKAISSKNVLVLDTIVKCSKFQIQLSTRENCLALVSLNNSNFEEILEYIIVNRPELNYYSTNAIVTKYRSDNILSPQIQVGTKRFINFYNFMNLKSYSLRLKILEIGCVEKSTIDYVYSSKLKPLSNDIQDIVMYIECLISQCSKTITTVISEIKNSLKLIQSDSKLSIEIKQQKLHQLIITKITKSLSYGFKEHLIKYDDILPDIDDQIVFEYTFSSFSVKGLKYLIQRKYFPIGSFLVTNQLINSKGNKELVKNDQDRVIEFFKLYFKQTQIYINSNSLNEIFNFICCNCKIQTIDKVYKLFKSTSLGSIDINSDKLLKYTNMNDESTLSSLSPDRFQLFNWYIDKFIQKSNRQLLGELVNTSLFWDRTVSEKWQIDYLLSFQSTITNYCQIDINSIELIKYFESKLKINTPLPKIYSNLFFKSICSGDLKTLDIIIGIFSKLEIKFDINLNQLTHLKTFYNPKVTLDTLNEISFKCCSDKTIYSILEYSFNKLKETVSIPLPMLKYNLFPNIAIKLFLNNIINGIPNENVVNDIILSLVRNGEFEMELLKEAISESVSIISFTITNGRDSLFKYKEYSSKQLIKFIKSLFRKLEGLSEESSILECGGQEINIIFSYLYKLLLQCQDTDYSAIEDVRSFYKCNNLFIKDDIFNLVYYLDLLSNRFTKYLIFKFEFDLVDSIKSIKINSTDKDYNLNLNSLFSQNMIMVLNDISYNDIFKQLPPPPQFSIIQDYKFESVFLKIRSSLFKYIPTTGNGTDIRFLIEIGKLDFIILLLELNDNDSRQCELPLQFYRFANVDQVKKVVHLLNLESKPGKMFELLNFSIKNPNFEVLDYLLNIRDGECLFKNQNQGTSSGNHLIFNEIINSFLSNDTRLISWLLSNHYFIFNNFKFTFKQRNINAEIHVFDLCFQKGQIEMVNLMLIYFPHSFEFTNEHILSAIKRKSYNIIQYYFQLGKLDHICDLINFTNDNIKKIEQDSFNYFKLIK